MVQPEPAANSTPTPSADGIAFGMWSLTHNLWRDHFADWNALSEDERLGRRAKARWVLAMAQGFDERNA